MDVEKEEEDGDAKDDGEETKDDQIKALEAKIEEIKGDGAGETDGDAVAAVEKAKEDVEMKDDGAGMYTWASRIYGAQLMHMDSTHNCREGGGRCRRSGKGRRAVSRS